MYSTRLAADAKLVEILSQIVKLFSGGWEDLYKKLDSNLSSRHFSRGRPAAMQLAMHILPEFVGQAPYHVCAP